MCMNWMSCLCWRETKTPSVAIVVFALVTSLIQIVVAIAVFSSIPVDMRVVTNPLYIVLAVADFFVVFFSILLLVGFERADDCHRWSVILWVGWVFLYILYESAINIFLFYAAFNVPSASNLPKGFVIVFIVYWICKEIILFTGWCFIVSHMCYGDALAVNYPDQTIQTIQVANKGGCGPNIYNGGCGPSIYNGGGGPNVYNGGVAQFQMRDNSCSRPAAVSHFDVVRPTSGTQVYCSNFGRGGGGCGYVGQDYNLPTTRYM